MTTTVSISVPEDMAPYLHDSDIDNTFSRNAMLLYPLIKNQTMSFGRAAEILEIHKTDLIEFYNKMGIPYLNQSREELMEDLSTLDRVLGEME